MEGMSCPGMVVANALHPPGVRKGIRMIPKTVAKQAFACLITLCLFACSPGTTTASSNAKAPPAPQMPAGWDITSDVAAPPAQVQQISQKLGGTLTSVRNTVYNANGNKVQLNTMIASDEANADKVMVKLKSMKSEEALLQKGTTVYEFVGSNDVIQQIRDGREFLSGK